MNYPSQFGLLSVAMMFSFFPLSLASFSRYSSKELYPTSKMVLSYCCNLTSPFLTKLLANEDKRAFDWLKFSASA